MTFGGFLVSFLGTLGGVAIGLVALRFLAARFIDHRLAKALADHKHGLDKELAAVQGGMSRLGDVLSRRNEREFSVTEKAWELMIKAFGLGQEAFGPSSKPPAIFKITGESETLDIIAKLSLDEEKKQALREAEQDERDDLHAEYELERLYMLCHTAWVEFKNYVSTHEIFFSEEIYRAFVEIRNDLYGVIVHVEMFMGPDGEEFTGSERIKVSKDLRDLDKKISEVAVIVRKRFGFDEQ